MVSNMAVIEASGGSRLGLPTLMKFAPGALERAYLAYEKRTSREGEKPRSRRGLLEDSGFPAEDLGRFTAYNKGTLRMPTRLGAPLASLLGARLSDLAVELSQADEALVARAALEAERASVAARLRSFPVAVRLVASWEATLGALTTRPWVALRVLPPPESLVSSVEGAAIRRFAETLKGILREVRARDEGEINLDQSRLVAMLVGPESPFGLAGLTVLEGRCVVRVENDNPAYRPYPRLVLVLRIAAEAEREALLKDGVTLDRSSEPLLQTYGEWDSEIHAVEWSRVTEWLGDREMLEIDPPLSTLEYAESRMLHAAETLEALEAEFARLGRVALRDLATFGPREC